MGAGIFSLDICATLFLASVLLWRYGDVYRQPILVTLSVLTAWYFSFLIIFILPLDVSSTVYRSCNISESTTTAATTLSPLVNFTTSGQTTSASGGSNGSLVSVTTPTISTNVTGSNAMTASTLNPVNRSLMKRDTVDVAIEEYLQECIPPSSLLEPEVLYSLWRIVYWSSQVLTWLILPIMQSFTQAGEFTFLGKLKSSLWDNAIYYCSYLFIAIILIIYIALQPDLHLDFQKLKAIAASASNTWGLTLLVFMLGYGLVEVPLQLWQTSKPGYRLNQSYFKVSKLWGEKSDAEGELEDVLSKVEIISRQGGDGDARKFLDIILCKVPTEIVDRISRRRLEPDPGLQNPTEKQLAALHREVNIRLMAYRRTQAQWGELLNRVYHLEDQQRNRISNERIFKHQIPEQEPSGVLKFVYGPTVEWYWECLLLPLLYKIGSILACGMSIMLTWSEVTFFVKSPPLSLFALFVQAASSNHNYPAIEIISFLTIMYMCICAYYTIFKVRVLNYYYLATNHQSDPYTLLFSGALLCRLTPPLCLNFLSLIHMDSHVLSEDRPETAYTKVMGHMDVVSIVSDYFNIYFPILLLILTVATYLSLGSRLLSTLGFQQFLVSDETSVELVEEGRQLIKREKRRREARDGAAPSAGTRIRFGETEEGTRVNPRQRYQTSSNAAPGSVGSQPPPASASQVPNFSSRPDFSDQPETPQQPPRNLFDDI